MTPPRHRPTSRPALLGLLGLLALAGACNNEPTVVEVRIDPPNADVRMTALFVVLIDSKTQNVAQVEPFLSVVDLTPPYSLNITPPEGVDLATLDVQARVFGYYDNGRGGTPLTAFGTLDRFQFLPGIQTRYIRLDPLALSCGQREGNSLGCLCYLDFGPDNTRDYPCYTAGQNCVPQEFGSGLPGAETLSICLPNEACPAGTVGCPCIGVIDGTCNAPYVCSEGTCAPCQDEGCGCTANEDCGAGLACAGAVCCNPQDTSQPCTCFSQRDCENAYPGQQISCVNNLCEVGSCSIEESLGRSCETGDECCGTPCFGGVCCSPFNDPSCSCRDDSDCVAARYPPGYACFNGACQAPIVACRQGEECCVTSAECGGYPTVCIDNACCDVKANGCPCESDGDCQTAEMFGLICTAGSCQPPPDAPDPCEVDADRPGACPCKGDAQCRSGSCCPVQATNESVCTLVGQECRRVP